MLWAGYLLGRDDSLRRRRRGTPGGIPTRDARETAEPAVTGISLAILRSSAHLSSWADLFVADFIAQGMKSAGWVFGFPAFLGRVEGTYAPVISRERLEPWSPVRMSLTIQALLAHSWAVYLGMLGATVLLLRVYLRSPREALCLFLLFGLLTSYPGAQYSVRYVFQFEAIWVVLFCSRSRSRFQSCGATGVLFPDLLPSARRLWP